MIQPPLLYPQHYSVETIGQSEFDGTDVAFCSGLL